MLIIGHRGALAEAPENTLASVMLGWSQKADAVEIDIHLSKDGRVMVMHDYSTARTTGADLKIAETNSAELRKLDAGSFKGSEFAGQRIPFLEEVIETIPAGKKLVVEIKCGPEVLPAFEKAVAASGKRAQIVPIGFGLETVAAAKKAMPDLPVYWLRSSQRGAEPETWLPHSTELIEQARAAGLDGLDLHYGGITAEVARAIKSSGLALYAWTVNDPVEAARLRDIGTDGLGTDRPGWLREQCTI